MPDVSIDEEIIGIVRLVAKIGPEVTVAPASRFIEDLGIDSLDLASIILAAFDRYEIPARGDQLPPLASVGELIKHVTVEAQRTGFKVEHHAADAGPSPHIAILATDQGRNPPPGRTAVLASVRARLGGLRLRFEEAAPTVGAALLPYAAGCALLRWLAAAHWPRRLLFRRQIDIVRKYLGTIGATERAEETIRISIASNSWNNWRLAALASVAPGRLDQWVHVAGFSHFERAHAERRGVILLHSHLPGHMLALLHVVRSGYSNIVAIGMTSSQLEALRLRRLKRAMLADETIWRGMRDLRFAHQFAVGERMLKEGGIVLIAADGQLGSRFREQPFHGRNRPIGVGFAELAAQTGAEVLPVFTTLETSGRITIEFQKPLATGGLSHEEQVDDLTLQYARRLERVWSTHAGNVTWHALERFLAFKPVEIRNERASVPA